MDDVDDFRDFDRMVSKVAKQGFPDVTIDRHISVFVAPDNSDWYVLLTKKNIDIWTREIVSIIPFLYHSV